jgi:hypothetical protein
VAESPVAALLVFPEAKAPRSYTAPTFTFLILITANVCIQKNHTSQPQTIATCLETATIIEQKTFEKPDVYVISRHFPTIPAFPNNHPQTFLNPAKPAPTHSVPMP